MMWRELMVAQVEVFVVTFACVETLRRTMRNYSHYSWCLGSNLNHWPTKYEAGLLTTKLLCSVIYSSDLCNCTVPICLYFYCGLDLLLQVQIMVSCCLANPVTTESQICCYIINPITAQNYKMFSIKLH